MSVIYAPNIFQDWMHCTCTYLDNLLVLSRGRFLEHLDNLEKVLERLSGANLRVNIHTCEFNASEIVYICYILTLEGIEPHPKKLSLLLI